MTRAGPLAGTVTKYNPSYSLSQIGGGRGAPNAATIAGMVLL
jgi:hypothetical protein